MKRQTLVAHNWKVYQTHREEGSRGLVKGPAGARDRIAGGVLLALSLSTCLICCLHIKEFISPKLPFITYLLGRVEGSKILLLQAPTSVISHKYYLAFV